MKISISVTDERRGTNQYGGGEMKEVVVAKFEDMEFTRALAANFLRALADDIDPPEAVNGSSPMPEFVPDRLPPIRPNGQWMITCSNGGAQ